MANWQRGNPRTSIVKVYMRCPLKLGAAALVNAAEVQYRINEQETGGATVLLARWPCPCPQKEHEGEVTRW